MLDDQALFNLSRDIIDNKIWPKLKLFLDNDREWYINLNNYITEEWVIINEIKVDKPLLDIDEDEEGQISVVCLNGIIDKMNITDEEFYKDYDKFDLDKLGDIVTYYIYIYK